MRFFMLQAVITAGKSVHQHGECAKPPFYIWVPRKVKLPFTAANSLHVTNVMQSAGDIANPRHPFRFHQVVSSLRRSVTPVEPQPDPSQPESPPQPLTSTDQQNSESQDATIASEAVGNSSNDEQTQQLSLDSRLQHDEHDQCYTDSEGMSSNGAFKHEDQSHDFGSEAEQPAAARHHDADDESLDDESPDDESPDDESLDNESMQETWDRMAALEGDLVRISTEMEAARKSGSGISKAAIDEYTAFQKKWEPVEKAMRAHDRKFGEKALLHDSKKGPASRREDKKEGAGLHDGRAQPGRSRGTRVGRPSDDVHGAVHEGLLSGPNQKRTISRGGPVTGAQVKSATHSSAALTHPSYLALL